MANVTLAHNAVVAKLVDPDRDIENLVSELLSYLVTGADQSFAFNQGSWDGRSSFYEFRTHSFPAGFVYLVHSELTRRGHKVRLIRRPHATPQGPERPKVSDFEPYDFQWRALAQVEKHGRGIIQVATGGGKSVIAKLIMARYRRMTLFLTTRGVLLYQMKDQLDALGLNTGIIGDGELKVTRGVNLGMVQTLVQGLEEPDIEAEHRAIVRSLHRGKNKKTDLDWKEIRAIAKERFDEKTKKRNQFLKILELVEVVIGEEAHEAGGNSYYQILRHCKNASIRVALTATPFMRDAPEDNLRLMAAFGSILIKITEKQLIERGILAKPYFLFHEAKPHPKLYRTSPWERAYKLGYVENPYLMQDAVRDALRAKSIGLPTLTLIRLKDHGAAIVEAYEKAGLRAVFIKGENDNEERRMRLNQLAAGELDVVIGTTIVDVGVDVPAVGLVQLLGGGKAEVALRQRIGRGLRAKKSGPNVAFVIDYSVQNNTKLAEHTRQRRLIVEGTEGFAEGICKSALPWHIFEQREVA